MQGLASLNSPEVIFRMNNEKNKRVNVQRQLPVNVIGKRFGFIFLILLAGFTGNLKAKDLKIGVSFSIPPYVIQETDTGIELELLQSALAVRGHKVNIEYQPFSRTFRELKEGKLDGIINAKKNMLEDVFYSDVVIHFQNCAISLKDKKLDINVLEDLKGKSIVAFQRASFLLGDDYHHTVKHNPNYSEIPNQILQVYMLMKKRTDVVVMDKNIFIYYLRQSYLNGKLNKDEVQQEVICHKVFPPTPYRFAFLHANIRDDFNLGLAQIKQDGTLLSIQQKYQRLLSLTLNEDVSIRLASAPK
jgi:polar amino acid transport system substrate-binding protein